MNHMKEWIFRLNKIDKKSKEMLEREFEEVAKEEGIGEEMNAKLRDFYYNLFFKDQAIRKDLFRRLIRLAKTITK